MFKFEELNVYQEAIKLTDDVYHLIEKWPRTETYALSDQLKRAALSIALNIAEGSSRSRKDFRHFLDIARGSCYECVAILTIAQNRGYITTQTHTSLYLHCERIAKMVSSLKKSLL